MGVRVMENLLYYLLARQAHTLATSCRHADLRRGGGLLWAPVEAVPAQGAVRAFGGTTYAPKDDRKHRAHWRETYSEDELRKILSFVFEQRLIST
jgi:hypothetical protein